MLLYDEAPRRAELIEVASVSDLTLIESSTCKQCLLFAASWPLNDQRVYTCDQQHQLPSFFDLLGNFQAQRLTVTMIIAST